jgi:hypothetical protein
MVVGVVEALFVMPRRGSPTAVVFVGFMLLKDEPTALHLSDALTTLGAEVPRLERQ